MEVIRNGKTAILMRKFGIKPALSGWRYLEEAINMVIEDPMILNGVTKILYPAIARKFKSTASRVERAIRHAIQTGFDIAPVNVIKQVFGNTINNDSARPTNSEFIAALAQVIANEPENAVWNM